MLIAVMLIVIMVNVVAPFKVMVQTTNCSLLKVKNTFERVLKKYKKQSRPITLKLFTAVINAVQL
jgi:hypothetical protein